MGGKIELAVSVDSNPQRKTLLIKILMLTTRTSSFLTVFNGGGKGCKAYLRKLHRPE